MPQSPTVGNSISRTVTLKSGGTYTMWNLMEGSLVVGVFTLEMTGKSIGKLDCHKKRKPVP